MPEAFRLLIGSMGDDSHSIGMFLLETVFRESGFFVKNIGIMNVWDDFFSRAENFDAVFISWMNEHADLYLKNFPPGVKVVQFKKQVSSNLVPGRQSFRSRIERKHRKKIPGDGI